MSFTLLSPTTHADVLGPGVWKACGYHLLGCQKLVLSAQAAVRTPNRCVCCSFVPVESVSALQTPPVGCRSAVIVGLQRSSWGGAVKSHLDRKSYEKAVQTHRCRENWSKVHL